MKSVYASLALLLGLSGVGHAATVLSVSGIVTPNIPVLDAANSPGALGVGFSVSSALSDLSFNIDYVCPGVCKVQAYLVNDIGLGADVSNLLASALLDGSSALAFSGINLTAGSYAIILASETGIFGWNATRSATVISAGITPLNSLLARAYEPLVPFASTFDADLERAFMYSITQADIAVPPAPVPLGAAGAFLSLGLIGLWSLRSRKAIASVS
jgi:hypothetical protein